MADALRTRLIAFARALRGAGIDAHSGRVIDLLRALPLIDWSSRIDVYHACRTLLISHADEIPAFDRAFEAFFSPSQRVDDFATPPASFTNSGASSSLLAAAVDLAVDGSGDERASRAFGAWSDTGGLANKDFAAFTSDEMIAAREAIDRLIWSPGARHTRRWERGHGRRIDLRRALRASVRTGGDMVRLPALRRRRRPRTLILLCDVSGSMERYSRMLLHFTHALARRHRRLEAFVFSTRLTRVTTELRGRQIDAAVSGVGRSVTDWSGGTRIGESLAQFHRQWARRVLHGGPVVLLISDGWDRGEPELLRDQIARLRRGSHRLIWLNPLLGSEGYAPLTRGLQAARPYVDDFLPARTLTDLASLALHLDALAADPSWHPRRSRVTRTDGHHRLLHVQRPAAARLGSADGSDRDRELHSRL
ncbi:MAG TPA: VWA domain-containing protein [Vicinamibacterales bacterium]|nr:VWA domain-containing protein [Vicinamibacterales bacterium]